MLSAPPRTTAESADTVGHVIALLVRFPEIATVAAHPSNSSIVVSFVVGRCLERAERVAIRGAVVEHVRTLLAACGESPAVLRVNCELDERVTFVRVTRDAQTMTREELALLTTLFSERFGDALLKSPAQDDAFDEDPAAADESVELALEALRAPATQKSLVGFREEKRVLVYFLRARKKAKAAAR